MASGAAGPGSPASPDDDRPATADDVHELCLALPHVTYGTSWGDMPTYLVSDPATKARPRGFCIRRRPDPTAVDPATGTPYEDLLVLWAADQGAKAALVEADGPFFTVPHLDGHDSLLVQESRLGEITRGELREVLTESWLRLAPAKLARAFTAAVGSDEPVGLDRLDRLDRTGAPRG
ncbi:hypothetical protein ACOACO_10845 [Nocardioides sp. CPCC 205120]|uniref:hypothetical protein n=1 Tax=Nocardioides sp. CPCC 205120 TaxID=3406462 RepID=UPI003B502C43